MRPSREAGAEEPLTEALEVITAFEAGRLRNAEEPLAGFPISGK